MPDVPKSIRNGSAKENDTDCLSKMHNVVDVEALTGYDPVAS
jgi:hypothetical protein